jgi:fluoride exporter
MMRFLLVCLGGAVGSGSRFALGSLMTSLFGTSLPYGTMTVNLLGSFAMGAVVTASVLTDVVTPTLRLVLTTGFLGGFTTYSAFNHETIAFLEANMWVRALANVLITVFGCLTGGLAGGAVARRLLVG